MLKLKFSSLILFINADNDIISYYFMSIIIFYHYVKMIKFTKRILRKELYNYAI